jgi:membrane-bound metal-dependent hydrolase YbcI (DUF457 family)
MTTYEHAMLGINGALAAGLQHRFGWKIIALAGVAAVAPDWDGLPMLINMAAFESGHRVWGHNILSCFLLAVALGTLDFRFDLSGRLAQRLARFGPLRELQPLVKVRQSDQEFGEQSRTVWLTWVTVCFFAALSQIPADAVVSGGKGLSDWALQPFWPFSRQPLIYPLIPWGNVGVTIIFAIGMLLMVRWKKSLQPIAITTLTLVIVYIIAWGTWMR